MIELDPITRLDNAQRELDCLAAALEAVCGTEAPRPQMVIEHAALDAGRIADELAEILGELMRES